MLHNIRLRYRLLVEILAIVFVVLAAVTVVSYILVRSALRDAVQSQALNLSKAKVGEIDGFFRELGTIPVVLANATAVDRENDEMLVRDRISEMMKHNPAVYGSTLAFEPYTFYPDQEYFSPYYSRTPDWTGLNYVQLGTDDYVYFRDWEWYTGPRDTGKLYWSLPYFDEGAGNIWMVTASYPITRAEEFIGVATMDVPIESIRESLGDLRLGERGYALMFDPSGGIIATSEIEGLGETATLNDLTNQVNRPELKALLELVKREGEGIGELPDVFGGSGNLWAVYTTVSSTQWHVVTFVSEEEMLRPVSVVLVSMIVLSTMGLLLLAGGVYFIANTITRPIETLRDEALAIAGGDLTRRVPAKGRDEIGAMGRAFNQMTDELQESLTGLEQRVAERTAKLAAAAEVSRTTTSELNLDKLQNDVVGLVRDRFELYYVGLFLLDEVGEYAVLRAGTGEAGREMLARGHKLAVGGSSMIGQCVARGEARIALDVGEEAVRFDNPVLPETRSEMALPLRSRGKVIGAMSVQSTAAAAFDETDISVMQTMADQVATAIDNAQLFEQVQESLVAERRAYGELTREAWVTMLRARPDLGYLCDVEGVSSVTGEWRSEMLRAGKSEQAVVAPDGILAVPVKVRDHVIGVVRLRKPQTAGEWNPDEIALVESLMEQLSAALDGARLHQDTLRRAAREQVIRQISERLQQAVDMESLLRTTTEELHKVLGTSRAYVHMGTEVELKEKSES